MPKKKPIPAEVLDEMFGVSKAINPLREDTPPYPLESLINSRSVSPVKDIEEKLPPCNSGVDEMPPCGLIPSHWRAFTGSFGAPRQGPVGDAPSYWIKRNHIEFQPQLLGSLKGQWSQKLTRQRVASICRNPRNRVLLGYICGMAWGGQRAPHAQEAWAQKREIQINLVKLRKCKNLSREDAYNLFCGDRKINHLGPAYFTKLLYFFNTPESCSGTGRCYIMDQWTARSVNLLTGRTIVDLSWHNRKGKWTATVAKKNTGLDYENFCSVIDCIALNLCCTGEEIEERLFCVGGHKPGAWRSYLRQNSAPR